MVTLLDLCVSSLRRGRVNLLCTVPTLTDDPRRESTWQGCRKKRPRPKAQGRLHRSFLAALAVTALATVHRDVRACAAEVGNRVGVSSLCENPLIRSLLSHVWVLIFLLFFFLLLFFLFRIFVVVFASAPTSTSICSFSLSLSLSLFLSLLPLEASVYLYLLCASPLECLCNKSKDRRKADSTLRTSRAVPQTIPHRALFRVTSEVERDPVHSARYGRQRIC